MVVIRPVLVVIEVRAMVGGASTRGSERWVFVYSERRAMVGGSDLWSWW